MFWKKRTASLLLVGLLVLAEATLQGARVPNTTLAVPIDPPIYSYTQQNAFGGLIFDTPVALVTAPGDTNRIFVVELGGTIQVVTNIAAPTKTLFLDITDRVDGGGEGGLLGMDFHPDWEANRKFFVYYTTTNGVPPGYVFYDRLSSFEMDPANPNAALPGSEQFMISQLDQANNHNAGDLHFGPDGYLYVSLGDEGGGGDTYGNSRSIDKDFFATILRIDVNRLPGNLEPNSHPSIHLDAQSKAYYSVPSDNPFVGATNFNGQAVDSARVRTEFWVAGLRNPWRFSFDPETGILYCADVGQGLWEEVNIISGGADYGWNLSEGAHPYSLPLPNGAIITDPILEYPHTGGPVIPGPPGSVAQGRSITGGVVYNGNRLGQLSGYYIFGDAVDRVIFAVQYDAVVGQVQNFQKVLSTFSGPVGFGSDPSNGDLLISHLRGEVTRLMYSSGPVQGQLPPTLLSQTGAFSELVSLTPEPGIVPYDVNVSFWSDHAIKSRWFSIPDINDEMTFDATGNWLFPTGTVWIKHFELELTNGVAASKRRLETRFIVKNSDGVHGFTYKWNAGQTDADLVAEGGEDEVVSIFNPDGSLLREQTWRYPARSECLQCHTPQAGFALGFNTVQLNREHDYGGGLTNQLSALSQVGYFDGAVPDPNTLPALAPADDESASLEDRSRSYLQANCVSCHQPGGTAQGLWDARIATPIGNAGLIDGPLINDDGDPMNKVVVPGDLTHSRLLQHILVRGPGQMPPLASTELDQSGISLLTDWINSLGVGGPTVPSITWSNAAPITYGTALNASQLNATANVAGVFAYTPPSGTILAAGNAQTLSVIFTPNDSVNYTTAQASVSINVTRAPLTVTAANKSKVYGAANPALSASYIGFVNGDTSASLDAPVNLTTTAVTGSAVGDYPITATGAADVNYLVSHVNGLLSVTRAPLTVTAANKSKVYGAANPALSASYIGFVNGDTSASLDAPVNLTTTAVTGSAVGDYPITATGAADVNYLVSHVNGLLRVTRAPLTVTADNKSKIEGQANPPLTMSYSGFANGDSVPSLTQAPSVATAADILSSPGEYPISVSGGQGANYNLTRVSGILTVETNSRFTPIEINLANRVTLHISGHPGRTYRVEVSTDLEAWGSFVSIQTDGNGQGTYVETSDPSPGNRYFRIVWP